MNGWIKLYRKSLNSAVFQNPNLFKVWIWCLLKANSNESYKILFEGDEISLKPGQFIAGRQNGSMECNMKESTFRNQLNKLKKLGNLDIKADNKKSLLTIVKWSVYQGDEQERDCNKDNKETTRGHKQEYKNKRINKSRLNIYSIANFNAEQESQLFYKNNCFFITESFKNELLTNFSSLDESLLKSEFYKMEDWLAVNGVKKDYKRFIINWLARLRVDYVKSNTPVKQEFPLPKFKFLRETNGQD